jgi:hypothetical protein
VLFAARRTLALRLWLLLACAAPFGAPPRSTAQAQAAQPSVGVLRSTSAATPTDLSEAVDAALLRDLAQLAGIADPVVSPIDLAEIQLSIGCTDEGRACLEAMAGAAGVSALLVRTLVTSEESAQLQLLYFDGASNDAPSMARTSVPAHASTELIAAVPSLVRELFGIPEVVEAAEPLSVEPPMSAAPAPVEPAPAPRDTVSPAPWVLAGVGAAALTVGIIVGAVAANDFDAWKKRSVRTMGDADRADEDFSDLETRAIAADLSMLAGAVLLGVGVSWLAVELADDGESAQARGSKLRLAPSTSGATLFLQGTFGEAP